jgi:hypothetical protein
MIWVAFGLSALLLLVTNLIAYRYGNLGRAAVLSWVFALVGFVPFILPAFLVHATLLALFGTLCVVLGLGAKRFFKGSLAATALAYLSIGAAAVATTGQDASFTTCWGAAERMHDGTIVDFGSWSSRSTAAPVPTPSADEPSPFHQDIHKNTFNSFTSVADFGMSRMVRLERMHHRAPVPTLPPAKDKENPVDLGDFVFGPEEGVRTVALQKVYTAPDGKQWELTRVQLVGLLKHKEPVVYRTDELVNMKTTSFDKVPTRELNKWESGRLEELKKGKELLVDRSSEPVRMFGAVRASDKCLQCHKVEKGELIGAFTYELRVKD